MDLINQFLPENVVQQMAILEEQYRSSEDYQKQCSLVAHIPNEWLNVTAEMQKNVVRQFGFKTEFEINIAVNTLRRAHIIWPDNEIFNKRIYVVNNKANVGSLKEGDVAPNIMLYQDKKPVYLHDLLKHKHSIVFAGSHT